MDFLVISIALALISPFLFLLKEVLSIISSLGRGDKDGLDVDHPYDPGLLDQTDRHRFIDGDRFDLGRFSRKSD